MIAERLLSRPNSRFAVGCLLLCLLALQSSFVHADDEELQRSDIVRDTNIDVNKALTYFTKYPVPSPTANHTKYAYVMIHYELGTVKDASYTLGVRVLIKSIRDSGSKHDVVVLISDNVSQETRDAFVKEGAILRIVPNIPNPYKLTQQRRRTYKARFEFTFNKLYVWNLPEYDRVMYLDADNLVTTNIDELFLCGHFCVAFLSPTYFHTGLMVIKPSTSEFKRLLKNLLTLESFSYDGADQGFLTAEFLDVDTSPMFDPKVPYIRAREQNSSAPVAYEDPTMRYPAEYNFNSVYWYPYFSFDFFRRANLPFSNHPDLPVGSISYCIGPEFKPWNWFPYIFFHTIRIWNNARMTLDDSWFDFIVARYVVVLLTCGGTLVLLQRLRTLPAFETARMYSRRALSALPTILPIAVFGVTFAVSFMSISELLPQVVPPIHAWPLALFIFFAYMYVSLNIFAALVAPSLTAQVSGGSSSFSAPFGAGDIKLAMSLGLHWDWFTTATATDASNTTSPSSSSSSSSFGNTTLSPTSLIPTGGIAMAVDGNANSSSSSSASSSSSSSSSEFDDPDWTDSQSGIDERVPVLSSSSSSSASSADPTNSNNNNNNGMSGTRKPIVYRGTPSPNEGMESGDVVVGLGMGTAGAGGGSSSNNGVIASVMTAKVAAATSSLRNGLSPFVLVLPFICLMIGVYFLFIATWHVHFVEKTVFFVWSVFLFVASFCYLFLRVSAVALGKPGALGVIVLVPFYSAAQQQQQQAKMSEP